MNQVMCSHADSTAINTLLYGEGVGPYLLDIVGCSGDERNLLECRYSRSEVGSHSCSSVRDAGAKCDGSLLSYNSFRGCMVIIDPDPYTLCTLSCMH